MNKKGFIKTVEAIIEILIIFIFIYYVTPKINENPEIKGIKSLQTEILKGISENEDFRECIITSEDFTITKTEQSVCPNIKEFIDSSLTPLYKNKYQLDVCLEGSCSGPPDEKTVYTSAIIITSSIKAQEYKPKIVRLYLW
jgi:hypothetical protein